MAAAVMPAGAKWGSDITFVDHDGYTNLSMYDCWEDSPFRTGKLTLTPRVVDNPNMEEDEIIGAVPNPSPKVVGAQRSRFGSNTFGVRVNLAEEDQFELTTDVRYVHVMLLKPTEGRVMLVGLGSRDDVPDQDKYVEQFWVESTNAAVPGKWNDMVFAVKGAGGITMRSLVLVPDLESPHNLTSDFLFYIDNIKVNTEARPEIVYDYYPTSFDKEKDKLNRSDRYTEFVGINSPKFGQQRVEVSQQADKFGYFNLTSSYPLTVEVGETITPLLGYKQTWMHKYCYVDFGNDGKFDIVDNGDDTYGGDAVSYSYVALKSSEDGKNGKDSAGKSANHQNMNLPSFTIPAGTKPGLYRMRFKLDWNCIDPEGNPDPSNHIIKNGGIITDVMLHVVEPGATATVNDFQLNGEILAADGSKLSSYEIPAFEDFKVLIAPENGFENNGFTFKVGYGVIDTEGETNRYDKYGNPNWFMLDFPLSKFAKDDNTMVIPGKYIFGKILLQGRMAQVGTREEYYSVNFNKSEQITRGDRHLDNFTFTPEGGEAQQISLADNVNPRMVYVEKLETPIEVYRGKTVGTKISYTGNSMHAYLYIDYNDNGFFAPELGENNVPTEKSELVSFSCYQEKNSLGQSVAKSNKPTAVPTFTIPETLEPGRYRARLKIDWDNINPGARKPEEGNKIWENGGAITDFYFDVKDPKEEEVGIEEITVESADKVYDLLGRKVIKPTKGNLMIVNGKTTKI